VDIIKLSGTTLTREAVDIHALGLSGRA
jgi:hypothetical protein